MEIYIICYVSSCILLYIQSKLDAKKQKRKKVALIVLALAIPCLLAGLRHPSIGTDVNVYVKPMFEAAVKSKSISEYFGLSWTIKWRSAYVSDYEIGFSLMVYLFGKLTNSLAVVLTVIEAIIIIPFFFSIKKIELIYNKKIMWFSFFVFYMMFFHISLNAMRQLMAISLVLLSFCFYLEKKYKKGLLGFAIGFLFHTSAILGIFIIILDKVVYPQKSIKILDKKVMKGVIIMMISLLMFYLIINIDKFVRIFSYIGRGYGAEFLKGGVRFQVNSIITRLPVIILFVFSYKKFTKKNEKSFLYIILYVFDIAISNLTSVNTFAGRIGYMYSIFNTISFPLIANSYSRKWNRNFVTILFCIYLIAYWYYNFILGGRGETYPYLSILWY